MRVSSPLHTLLTLFSFYKNNDSEAVSIQKCRSRRSAVDLAQKRVQREQIAGNVYLARVSAAHPPCAKRTKCTCVYSQLEES